MNDFMSIGAVVVIVGLGILAFFMTPGVNASEVLRTIGKYLVWIVLIIATVIVLLMLNELLKAVFAGFDWSLFLQVATLYVLVGIFRVLVGIRECLCGVEKS